MTTLPLHAQLRVLLVHLYPTLADAKRIADDAVVDHNRIAPDDNLANYWHALLREAQKQSRLSALLTCVSTEYPQHHELAATIAAYQREIAPLSDIRLLNFAHPMTSAQQRQIEVMLGKRLDLNLIKHIEAKFEETDEYEPQCDALIARIGFTPNEWKSLPIIVNPPVFAPIAVCLLAELHGRMRHFPTVLRIRPMTTDGVRTYEVAEIMNLQEIRDRARNRL